MTATNHALTGALIGMVIGQPVVAIAIAFLSHFALDSLPHFGASLEKQKQLLIKFWSFDFLLLCVGLVCLLLVDFPDKLLIAACAIAAMSPDIAWIYRYLWKGGGKELPLTSMNAINKFHAWVQWYQKPKGVFVEILWLLTVSVFVLSRIV